MFDWYVFWIFILGLLNNIVLCGNLKLGKNKTIFEEDSDWMDFRRT